MILQVDPGVRETMETIAEYWVSVDEELGYRIQAALHFALRWIAEHAEAGRRVQGLPAPYRRVRVAADLPGYWLFYRYNPSTHTVLVFLLRHEHQRPYAPSTLRRKAGEAQGRTDRPPPT